MSTAVRLIAGIMVALVAGQAEAAEPVPVIGRGGAAITFPADTSAALDLALAERADGLWIDVTATADGVLIARPTADLATSTNARTALGPLQLPKDAPMVSGYPAAWIPYAGYARLAARHEDDSRDQRFNDLFPAPLLADLLTLINARQPTIGRPIRLIIHLVDPGASAAQPIEAKVVSTLAQYHLGGPDGAMIATGNLASLGRLRAATRARLILVYGGLDQPISGDSQPGRHWADLETPQGLAEVAKRADAIAVPHSDLIGRDQSGNPLPPSALASDARAAGLGVYATGFARPGTAPLPRDQALAEYQAFGALGLDGVITDEPARALEAYQ